MVWSVPAIHAGTRWPTTNSVHQPRVTTSQRLAVHAAIISAHSRTSRIRRRIESVRHAAAVRTEYTSGVKIQPIDSSSAT